jgi:hypothetical protein
MYVCESGRARPVIIFAFMCQAMPKEASVFQKGSTDDIYNMTFCTMRLYSCCTGMCCCVLYSHLWPFILLLLLPSKQAFVECPSHQTKQQKSANCESPSPKMCTTSLRRPANHCWAPPAKHRHHLALQCEHLNPSRRSAVFLILLKCMSVWRDAAPILLMSHSCTQCSPLDYPITHAHTHACNLDSIKVHVRLEGCCAYFADESFMHLMFSS